MYKISIKHLTELTKIYGESHGVPNEDKTKIRAKIEVVAALGLVVGFLNGVK